MRLDENNKNLVIGKDKINFFCSFWGNFATNIYKVELLKNGERKKQSRIYQTYRSQPENNKKDLFYLWC